MNTQSIYNNDIDIVGDDLLVCDGPVTEVPDFSDDYRIMIIDVKNRCELQDGHFNTAIDILARILITIYNTTNIQQFYEDVKIQENICQIFSENLSRILIEQKLAPSTQRVILCAIKKILNCLDITKSFISKINIHSSSKIFKPNDRLRIAAWASLGYFFINFKSSPIP